MDKLIPGTDLPDQMTGLDLVRQENHEMKLDRKLFNDMDSVDRRDKRNHIRSHVANSNYLNKFSKINFGSK